jgi:hypothetical protein
LYRSDMLLLGHDGATITGGGLAGTDDPTEK